MNQVDNVTQLELFALMPCEIRPDDWPEGEEYLTYAEFCERMEVIQARIRETFNCEMEHKARLHQLDHMAYNVNRKSDANRALWEAQRANSDAQIERFRLWDKYPVYAAIYRGDT